MHHLHFRYVAEQPSGQTLRRLFQLLDDIPADQRHALLRDVYVPFDAISDEPASGDEIADRYTTLKSKLQKVVGGLAFEVPVVYGLVCFILGNVHDRSTRRIRGVIERQKRSLEALAGFNDKTCEQLSQAFGSLRAEEDVLRKAYDAFCELVVGPLLGEVEVMDFGSEWAFDDSEPLSISAVKEQLQAAADSRSGSEVPAQDKDPVVSAFLHQLAAHFEATLRERPHSLAVRVGDRAVSVSVGRYSEPSKKDPSQPLILRLNIHGLSVLEPAFRRLGLPVNPKYHLSCRMEFSVLPSELSLLAAWTAEWIQGQVDIEALAPQYPLALDGDGKDRAVYEPGDPRWRDIVYLWSKAAREVFRKWEQSHERESEDGEGE